ncbi:S8 family serine peptidase [Actinoplanes sp. NPDC049599]|uniref:S8 family serine peptidase n=1 Tax=Actinoplanes sp. NPDC049599 TaxID=3363903 RepID=UPI00378BD140
MRRTCTALVGLLVLLAGLVGVPQAAWAGAGKLEPALRAQLADGGTGVFWVMLRDDPGARPARGTAVFGDRTGQADRRQAGLRRYLRDRRVGFTPYWIVDTIRVTGDARLAAAVAARPEVSAVLADRVLALPRPAPGAGVAPIGDVEWNIDRIGAPRVWSGLDDTGAGIVVATIDTGVQYDHPALAASYRGRGADGSVTHDYNWFDPTGLCPAGTPCDTNGHGTHTMGTMAGGGNPAVGVAPGARWIAAKGCESSGCSAAALLAAGQWILAPTDRDGRNPRPDLAPDVVNNSWGGPGADPWYQQVVAAWVAAGIFPAFSAGNTGPGCATVGTPGGYAFSYASGALDRDNLAAAFSSRGGGGDAEVKPDLAAPGVDVRSSVPGGYASYSGTSMASPHTAGTVALLWSKVPGLRHDVAATRQVLDATAVDTADPSCGGAPEDNNVYGEGRLDAYAAVTRALNPPPTASLRGVVTGPAGAVAGVRVALGSISTRTDAAGQYRLTAPLGTYVLRVTPPSGCLAPAERRLDLAGDAEADVVLPARTDVVGHTCAPATSDYRPGTTRVELTGDDVATELALPFGFDHYGVGHDRAWVSSNGLLSFAGPDTAFTNRPVPDEPAPNAALYAFWDDLVIDEQAGVYTSATADAFVVEWRNVTFFADRGQRVSVTAELRVDGSVTYRYRGLTGPLADGRSATIGIENADGRDGLTAATDTAGAVGEGTGVTFRPPAGGIVRAVFHVTAPTTWGQQVLVVGDAPALGGWDPARGLALDAAGYPVWSGTTGLPPNTAVAYKYVLRNSDGSVTWEGGANRTTVTPPTGRYETHDTFGEH